MEELLRTVERVLALARRTLADVHGQLPPVFGYLRLDTGLRELDVLVSTVSRTAEGEAALALIDWQSAPLAEVFFTGEVGAPYELALEDRQLSGRVLARAVLEVDRAGLRRVAAAGLQASHTSSGWEVGPLAPCTVAPRPASARTPFRSPIEVTLDEAQQAVVDLPASRSVLLLGEAGFGKTTVALTRLLALARGRPDFRAAVVVPSVGLKRLTELVLARRRADIEVQTYEAWARALARRTFRDVPHKESAGTPARTVRLKRSRALAQVLPEFVKARPGRRAGRRELLHLLGDTAWLQRVRALDGQLPEAAVAETAAHTAVQFSRTAEAELRHVDLERLQAVDGRLLDDGTPTEDVHSVDVEDYALLFELQRLTVRHPAPPASLDCLVVDEAQELAALELKLLGRCVRPGGTVIVAGDAAQQVDESADFGGWAQVLADVGAPDAERAELKVSYRNPPDVTALARSVARLPSPAAALPEAQAPLGATGAISWVARPSACHLALSLVEALGGLLEEDRTASVAVITRTAQGARRWAHVLGYALPVHLALEGDFRFAPGLTVTCVPEVKGLEFDVVVLPDADASTYPDTAEARRALYVALTRASHRLVLGAAGPFSALLSPAGSPKSGPGPGLD